MVWPAETHSLASRQLLSWELWMFFSPLSALGCLAGLLVHQRGDGILFRLMQVWTWQSFLLDSVDYESVTNSSTGSDPCQFPAFPEFNFYQWRRSVVLCQKNRGQICSSVSTTVTLEWLQPRFLKTFLFLEKWEDVLNCENPWNSSG